MLRTVTLCLLSLAAFAQMREAPRAKVGKGSIEGTVSDGSSHEPVKKAQVTLAGTIERPLTVASDAGGRFTFTGLPAGNYWLSASKTGYNPPRVVFGSESASGIQLNNDEHKKNVEVLVMPAATIAGRVLNEEGTPIRGCSVSAVQPQWQQNQRRLNSVSGAGTNMKGEYLLQNLAEGRYYLFAQCQNELPAPHPLLPRGDPRIPHETYKPQFYGGGLDPSTATRLTLQAGAALRDMNFRMARVPALTLRGTVTGSVPEALAGGATITLFPADSSIRNLFALSAGVDAQKNTFEIGAVIPGSYLLSAFSNSNGRSFSAQRPVAVGTALPDPVTISLTAGAELKGTVQFDCDEHPPLENMQVMLMPVEESPFPSQANAQLDKDGAFTLDSVMPGRWRVMPGVPGYMKSVSLAGQAVSPYALQIAPGASGPLRIVLGCKAGEISASISGAPSGRTISGLLYPDDTERLGSGLERVGSVAGSDKIEFAGIAPGRYRLLATDMPNPWPLLQQADVLKSLDSMSTLVEVSEGAHVNVAVEVIPRDDIERAIDERQ